MDGRLTLEMGEGKEKIKMEIRKGFGNEKDKLICHLCVEIFQL